MRRVLYRDFEPGILISNRLACTHPLYWLVRSSLTVACIILYTRRHLQRRVDWAAEPKLSLKVAAKENDVIMSFSHAGRSSFTPKIVHTVYFIPLFDSRHDQSKLVMTSSFDAVAFEIETGILQFQKMHHQMKQLWNIWWWKLIGLWQFRMGCLIFKRIKI